MGLADVGADGSGSGDGVLLAHCAMLRQSLQTCQGNHDRLVGILGSFDQRLSTLETAMRPTQEKTEKLRTTHKNIDTALKSAEVVLKQYDVPRQVEHRVRQGPGNNVGLYLDSLERLRSCVAYFEANRSFKGAEMVLPQAKSLLNDGINGLEDALSVLLKGETEAIDPAKLTKQGDEEPNKDEQEEEEVDDEEDDDSDDEEKERRKRERAKSRAEEKEKEIVLAGGLKVPKLVTPASAKRIHELITAMIKSGNEKSCLKVFLEVRSMKLEQGLRRIGVEKMTREQLESISWTDLESRIEGWRKKLRNAMFVVFPAERQLCETLLAGADAQCERIFAELGSLASSMLFSFGEAIARGKKTPEKLPVIMDMYETVRDTMPQMNVVFAGQGCSSLRAEAHGLMQRLASAARETFTTFEETVKNEPSERMPLDGSTHGLTSYVVNFIKYLYLYRATLQELFKTDKISEATVRVFVALQENLERKAKLYKDQALSQLFLMNNMHYIVHSVRKSKELKELLGDDWVHRHRRVVQQHASAYQRTSWNRVFTLLSAQGLSSGGKEDTVSRSLLKERFKTFNAAFEELHRTQCLWKIQDSELRSAVQLQIAEVLLPAYRAFLTRYSPVLEARGHFGKSDAASKYIRYKEDNLDTLLNEFFQGRESRNILVAGGPPQGSMGRS